MATAGLRPSPDELAVRTIGAIIADPTGALTDSTTGTAATTLIDLNSTFSDTELQNAIASLANSIESNRATLVLILAELRTQNVILT